jgi:hypothetical protein
MAGVLEELEDEVLEELYDRTTAVVAAIDEDGDGSADARELAQFFETMQSLTAGGGAGGGASRAEDTPEEEAEMVIAGVGDGSRVELEALTELLMETFAEDMELLGDIEDILLQKRKGEATEVESQMAEVWTAGGAGAGEGGSNGGGAEAVAARGGAEALAPRQGGAAAGGGDDGLAAAPEGAVALLASCGAASRTAVRACTAARQQVGANSTHY